jgi:hypothetical protein
VDHGYDLSETLYRLLRSSLDQWSLPNAPLPPGQRLPAPQLRALFFLISAYFVPASFDRKGPAEVVGLQFALAAFSVDPLLKFWRAHAVGISS